MGIHPTECDAMAHESLQQLLDRSGDTVALLRNSRIGAYIYPIVPTEFGNWRDEQVAWQKTAVLFDQSHHMAEITMRGPEALRLCTHATINSFREFVPGKAKQMVPLSHDGYVIGDGILFYLGPEELLFVGRAPTVNWLEYLAKTAGFKVDTVRDDRSPSNPYGAAVTRRHYRYQVQGPNAAQVLEKLHGAKLPEIKFFNLGWIDVKGRKVRALRHGMAGAPGLELFGPYAEREDVRQAIIEAGRDFGLVVCGARTYSSNTLESGWIPSPLPAVYTGEKMRPYREYLPANGYEGTCSIGGSFVSKDIEDYYVTPHEMGYGPFVKLDHDFIGREALERRVREGHRRDRKKVTYEWNGADLGAVTSSLYDRDELPCKFYDLPNANYSSASYDSVTLEGKSVGFSMFAGYSHNERCGLSLGIVDSSVNVGDELVLVWGEENGGTRKPVVERHRQCEVRVRVAPTPYSRLARETYHDGWRTRQA